MSAFKGQFNKKQSTSYAEPGIDDFIFNEDEFEIPSFTLKAVDDLHILNFIWKSKDGLLYNICIEVPHRIHAKQIIYMDDTKPHEPCSILRFPKINKTAR